MLDYKINNVNKSFTVPIGTINNDVTSNNFDENIIINNSYSIEKNGYINEDDIKLSLWLYDSEKNKYFNDYNTLFDFKTDINKNSFTKSNIVLEFYEQSDALTWIGSEIIPLIKGQYIAEETSSETPRNNTRNGQRDSNGTIGGGTNGRPNNDIGYRPPTDGTSRPSNGIEDRRRGENRPRPPRSTTDRVVDRNIRYSSENYDDNIKINRTDSSSIKWLIEEEYLPNFTITKDSIYMSELYFYRDFNTFKDKVNGEGRIFMRVILQNAKNGERYYFVNSKEEGENPKVIERNESYSFYYEIRCKSNYTYYFIHNNGKINDLVFKEMVAK